MTRASTAARNAAPPLLLLVCLLPSRALVAAQSPTPPAHAVAAPTPAAAPLVTLNVIVTDGSGRSVVDVRQEEVSVTEGGRPQPITRFAKEERPVSYALLLDGSRSVEPLLDIIRRTGATITNGNRAGDETFIVRFVDTNNIVELQDFTSDPLPLAQTLSRFQVEGGQTAVIDAVYVAVRKVAQRRKDEAGRRRSIVLISDCEDRNSFHTQSELAKLLRQEGVQVFAIAFLNKLSDEGSSIRKSPREKARKLAELIAEESGGRAFFPKNVDELIKAAEEVSRDLRSQYVLSYSPTNPKADGKFRGVEVKIADAPDRAKRKAITRPGYVAPGGKSAEEKKGK